MTEALVGGGLGGLKYEVAHRDASGRLICQLVSVQEPPPPKMLNNRIESKDIINYYRAYKLYQALIQYNEKRVMLCYQFRNARLPNYIREAKPMPDSYIKAKWGVFKINLIRRKLRLLNLLQRKPNSLKSITAK